MSEHAHQKGIIHRDLKPSNILVTINDGKAVPKVIDFGVAKATQGRLTEQTVYTQFQQMIGTPLYMSPELTSLDIDTRSDIYALRVLLYKLLTGHTPIEQDTLARVGLDEIRRLIREVDPPRPSLRLKTLAAAEMTTAGQRRNTEPTKLADALVLISPPSRRSHRIARHSPPECSSGKRCPRLAPVVFTVITRGYCKRTLRR